jgi:hypothetical protein
MCDKQNIDSNCEQAHLANKFDVMEIQKISPLIPEFEHTGTKKV